MKRIFVPTIFVADNSLISVGSNPSNWTLLCLSITALCLSFPMNGLSPSLSMVAHDFKFDNKERDIYLGSYIALSTMLGQMIGSFLSGVLSDLYSRKRILVYTLLIGSLSTILFGIYFMPYFVLLILRVFTGGCQGAVVPVLFSLVLYIVYISIRNMFRLAIFIDWRSEHLFQLL